MRIAHLTSVHPRYDTRIFLKQCRSLATSGHEVTLVVADAQPDEVKDGVRIVSVGRSVGRADRMLRTTRRVYRQAVELDADVYHLHDPELLPIGLKLKRRGKRVIFDAHEDVPKQILGKHYLWRPLRRAVSGSVGAYEAWVCRRLDAVVTATPYIRDKFVPINPRSVDINNFPMLGELVTNGTAGETRANQVCYVGGITAARGIREMVGAMDRVRNGVRLQLGGTFGTTALADEVRAFPGWERVDERGWLGRTDMARLFASSLAGIVAYLPAPNHIDAQPNKMFEYMSAGLPVIASHFPLWQEIIEGNACGLCVDPEDPNAIADAIDRLVDNPAEARKMGANGKRAVETRYNWTVEEQKLIDLYQGLEPTTSA